MPHVRRSIEIQAPPTVVWRWLATQEALRQWFSPNLKIDFRVGGAYRFFGPDNKTWISGKVLELKPEDRLILSWIEEGGDWVHPKRLVISLAPTPAGTRVTLPRRLRRHRHSGLESYDGGLSAWSRSASDPGKAGRARQC